MEGHLLVGRSIQRDAATAIGVAYAEALERFCCKHISGVRRHTDSSKEAGLEARAPELRSGLGQFPPGGFAVHLTADEAIESARQELIERDAFFCHFMTGRPFLAELQVIDGTKASQLLKSVLNAFYLKGHPIHLFQLESADPSLFAVAALAIRDDSQSRPLYGCLVGLGASEAIEEAATKAAFEVIRNLSDLIIKGHTGGGSQPTWLSASSAERLKWALNPKSAAQILPLLNFDKAARKVNKNRLHRGGFDLLQIKTDVECTPAGWPFSCPLFAASARSEFAPNPWSYLLGSNSIQAQRIQERLSAFDEDYIRTPSKWPTLHPLV